MVASALAVSSFFVSRRSTLRSKRACSVATTSVGLLVLLFGSLYFAGSARAEDSDEAVTNEQNVAAPRGFTLGVRSGFAIPLGNIAGRSGAGLNASDGSPLRDTLSGHIPIWVDLGWRFNDHVYVGVYGSYGFGILPSNVCRRLTCSATVLRAGVDAQWHWLPANRIDPWVGIGVGYETVSLSGSQGAVSYVGHLGGVEAINAHFGLDYRVSDSFAVGPTVVASVAQYEDISASLQIGPTSSEGSFDANKSFHSWILLGLRGEFVFGKARRASTSLGARTTPAATEKDQKAPAQRASVSVPLARTTPSVSEKDQKMPGQRGSGATPAALPTGIASANREQCSFRCMSDNVGVGATDLERAVSPQLGAIRNCAIQSGESIAIPLTATFGPDGELTFAAHTGGSRATMRECVSAIPLPAAYKGPPNQRWKCTDYCP